MTDYLVLQARPFSCIPQHCATPDQAMHTHNPTCIAKQSNTSLWMVKVSVTLAVAGKSLCDTGCGWKCISATLKLTSTNSSALLLTILPAMVCKFLLQAPSALVSCCKDSPRCFVHAVQLIFLETYLSAVLDDPR